MRTVLSKEYCFEDDRPFASCHASTLLPLADGRVLVAWFGGSHESHGDVAIWAAEREPGDAGNWTPARILADEPHLPHWNPVLARAPDGTIHLFYKIGPNPRIWKTRVIRSDDEAATWSAPRQLEDIDGYTPGPVKNKPIITDSERSGGGTWIAPTSKETEGLWDCAVTISNDNGARWEISQTVPIDRPTFDGKGAIQPTVWETAPGKLSMLARTTAGLIYRSTSTDGGHTWSTLRPTDLPNNNSGIDCARRDDGLLALVYNHVPANWGRRSPLHVIFSTDDGATWRDPLALEHYEPTSQEEERINLDQAHRTDEFSYPAIVADGKRFLIAYTWRRERIAFRELHVTV